MHLRILHAVIVGLLVAGCTTTPAERRARDEAQCRSYGFAKRNDAFAECMQRIDLARQLSLRANGLDTPMVYGPAVIVAR